MKQSQFEFYNTDKSFDSAVEILKVLYPYFKGVKNFQDVGSGVGAWSKVMENLGFNDYLLIDHPAIQKDKLLIENKDAFLPIDLDKEIPPIRKFDLSICIEVLEHFEENRAFDILDYLTESSDLILFSAAVPFQKGNGHINEKNHSFWHNQFQKRGYQFFDGFKRGDLLCKSNRSNFFHFQNIFLYFRSDKLIFPRELNITSDNFELRSTYYLNKDFTISDSLKILKKAIFNSIERALKFLSL